MKESFMTTLSRRSLYLASTVMCLSLSTSLPLRASAASKLNQGVAPLQNAISTEEMKEHEEEFMKARQEQADYFAKQREAIEAGEPFDVAGGSCKYISSIFNPPPAKVVTLTFDDGPAANLTPRLLDILKKYNVKATFFVLGKNAKSNLDIIERAQNEGHMIASHSWSHPNFHTLSQAQQTQQVRDTDEVIHSYASPRKYFRYPYGNSTCYMNSYIKSLGYSGIVGWHIDTCDWAYARTGSVTAAQAKNCEVAPANRANYVGHVMSEVQRHNGGIVLMHDVHANTVESVEEIIVRLKKAGYTFANLDDIRMSEYIH
jgi:peptidoglycan/xylan/chitin deacetylase (PgdA/CDA1 family)